MSWLLTLESLDTDDASKEFDSKEEAIDYAVVWFCSGYDPEENETLNGRVPLGVAEDVQHLLSNLKEGKDFRCSRFFEHVTLIEQ